jgi:hypothetical protein
VDFDRSTEAEISLRTRRPPNRLFAIWLLGVLVLTFGGFFVYWLRTGSWTITTLDAIGSILWFGPLLVASPYILVPTLRLVEPHGTMWEGCRAMEAQVETRLNCST